MTLQCNHQLVRHQLSLSTVLAVEERQPSFGSISWPFAENSALVFAGSVSNETKRLARETEAGVLCSVVRVNDCCFWSCFKFLLLLLLMLLQQRIHTASSSGDGDNDNKNNNLGKMMKEGRKVEEEK